MLGGFAQHESVRCGGWILVHNFIQLWRNLPEPGRELGHQLVHRQAGLFKFGKRLHRDLITRIGGDVRINERHDRGRESLDFVDLVDGFADQRRKVFGFGLGILFAELLFEEFFEGSNLLLVIFYGGFKFF